MATPDIEIRENVPLAPLTTLGVGGNARFFVRASSVAEVEQAVAFARNGELDLFVLGGGSNLVVSDRGFNGLVVQIAIEGIQEWRGEGTRYKTETRGSTEKHLQISAPEGQPTIAQRFQRWGSGTNDS